MSAIFKREFKSYFTTPVGFVFLAIYTFFLGLYFSLIYSYGSPDINNIIIAMSTIAAFTVPILTMKLMSEDRKQKTDQALLTAPVKLTGIVFGKFFAALVLFALAFAPTVIFEVIVAAKIQVNFTAYIYSLVGAVLLGAALISVGMFISSLTESPVISAILALVVNILVLYISNFASLVKTEWIANVMRKIAFINAFESFGEEIISIPDIIYFLSITAAFVFLSVRSLEKRRWA